ncbi:MAG: autoantigen p27 domain-containing protein [Thermoproteota archaeon]|nr:autoantigen p27 domain-containing protein [Thermoproteota archaeon]
MSNDSIKRGANYLLKGGTLLSESCQNCNGLLIKYKDNVFCLNCVQNAEEKINEPKKYRDEEYNEKIENENEERNKDFGIASTIAGGKEFDSVLCQVEHTLYKNIKSIVNKVNDEKDFNIQMNNLKLLNLFLKALDQTQRLKH